MSNKSIEQAHQELKSEIDEETVKQIELGYLKFDAIDRATMIVRNRRQYKASGFIKILNKEK